LALTVVWQLSYAMKDGLLPIACEKSGLTSRLCDSPVSDPCLNNQNRFRRHGPRTESKNPWPRAASDRAAAIQRIRREILKSAGREPTIAEVQSRLVPLGLAASVRTVWKDLDHCRILDDKGRHAVRIYRLGTEIVRFRKRMPAT